MKPHGPGPATWTPHQRREWDEWYGSRPEAIRALIDARPPWQFYRIPTAAKPDDYYVLVSYREDGTARAQRIDADTDEIMWDVFGLDPDELVPVPHSECCKADA